MVKHALSLQSFPQRNSLSFEKSPTQQVTRYDLNLMIASSMKVLIHNIYMKVLCQIYLRLISDGLKLDSQTLNIICEIRNSVELFRVVCKRGNCCNTTEIKRPFLNLKYKIMRVIITF